MRRIHKADKRIVTLFYKGLTLKRIAQRIGRPGDIERVIDALQCAKIPEEVWRKQCEQ